MLRITTIPTPNATTLKLEGKLLRPWTTELLNAFESVAAPPASVHLDLRDLTFADTEGIHLLHDLLTRGAQIAACSDFVSALLQREVIQ